MQPITVTEQGRLLVYRLGYSADFVRETLQKEQLNGLSVLALIPEETPRDLEFLRDFSCLERLEITASVDEDFDYGFLAGLPRLQHLMLNVQLLSRAKPRPIDWGWLPRLQSLSLTWRDNIVGWDRLTQLESLCLVELRGEDLRWLAGAQSLRKLQIKTATLRSVAGIEAQGRLETLLLGGCRRLRLIDDLAALAELRELTFVGCQQLTQLDALAALPRLLRLKLDDCPRLESIRPIAELRLERLELAGTTNVIDGDITAAAGARELFYRPRAHYNARLPTPLQDALVEENRRKILGGA